MRYAAIILVLSLVCPFEVRAEGNCPSGYYPIGGGNAGWTGCAPMGSSSGSGSSEPANPGSSWATRWGAIATDRVGTFGIEGLESKRGAKGAGLAECRKHGGKKCKIQITYRNQCGVLAVGEKTLIAATGPDIKETTQRAMNLCGRDGNQNCEPYYAGCSYPQQIR